MAKRWLQASENIKIIYCDLKKIFFKLIWHTLLYSHMVTPANRNIGTLQLRSSSIPNARLLATAPHLPKQAIMHNATADICVGKMSTATLESTKFAVDTIRVKMHAVMRICSEDLTKYIPRPATPATSIVTTTKKKKVKYSCWKDKPEIFKKKKKPAIIVIVVTQGYVELTRHCSTTNSICQMSGDDIAE